MKKCEEHHGDIEYDEKIYLECPVCKASAKVIELQEEHGEIITELITKLEEENDRFQEEWDKFMEGI